MRKSREELLEMHPIWNEERHDIVKVMYGDDPLICYNPTTMTKDKIKYEDSVRLFIYSQNGSYKFYRTLQGEIGISDNGNVLYGDFSVKYNGMTYDIILNDMYGLHSLTILRLSGSGKVKGWCNKDGQGSPANKMRTEELNDEIIVKVLNSDISDFGESVHKFFDRCIELYNEGTTNYIMDKTFNL